MYRRKRVRSHWMGSSKSNCWNSVGFTLNNYDMCCLNLKPATYKNKVMGKRREGRVDNDRRKGICAFVKKNM